MKEESCPVIYLQRYASYTHAKTLDITSLGDARLELDQGREPLQLPVILQGRQRLKLKHVVAHGSYVGGRSKFRQMTVQTLAPGL